MCSVTHAIAVGFMVDRHLMSLLQEMPDCMHVPLDGLGVSIKIKGNGKMFALDVKRL